MLLFIVPSLRAQPGDSVRIEAIYTTGWQYIHTRPDSAFLYFEKGKIESEKGNYLTGIVTYHNYTAALEIAKGRNEKALEHYQQAIEIAKKNGFATELGLTYMKKGTLCQFMGEYDVAAEAYLAAAFLLKSNEDRKNIIGLYKNLISTLDNLRQQNQSLQNVLPALHNDNTSEKEIVSILSQKKNTEASLNFPDQTTLREITGGDIYVLFGGAKFRIENFHVLSKYSNYRSVRKIPDGMLARIPNIPHEGTILREFNDKTEAVWLVKDKQRHRIGNPEVLEFFGGWDALCTVPERTLEQVPDAGDMVTLQNVLTTFNFKKEYEVLIDTLKATLLNNTYLLAEVGKKLKAKNNELLKRKILLWTSFVGIVALLCIGFLLTRNGRQKQKIHQQSLQALKAEQELQRSMELEKERTRIATDMHDDLGAGLTRVIFLAENLSDKITDPILKRDTEKLRQTSVELVENMSEIIWAMNEKNNSLEDLVFFLRSYAVDYCTENGLTCEFNLPDNLPSKIIGGQIRRNVFLILKESLHNIVKHAGAKNVIIHLRVSDMLLLTITDDGKGYVKNKSETGNGLLNIAQRVRQLKGKFSINNSSGTVIHLEVPV